MGYVLVFLKNGSLKLKFWNVLIGGMISTTKISDFDPVWDCIVI